MGHKKIDIFLINLFLLMFLLAGCGTKSPQHTEGKAEELKDGVYQVNVLMEGGSGRASVDSPCDLTVEDGKMTARIQWSSSHYDYMKIGEEKYLPVNEDGNSVFEIPVQELDTPLKMIADTTAMSTAHEIEYSFTFSMEKKEEEVKSSDSSPQTSDLSDAFDAKSISKELVYDHSLELKYAKAFMVDYYKDDYALIQIAGDGAFLLIPEGKEIPSDISQEIRPLKQPLNNIYLVASAVMDMFRSIDALDQIGFSGTKKENWYLEEIQKAMDQGDILYAGKYSAPDYEKIMEQKCNLAIENTMIYHSPAVKEQLERFGITVLVDHSSYEEEPLGRTEWVKLYGLLTGKEELAEQVFQKQIAEFDQIDGQEKENSTVAFFYFTNDGQVNVRSNSDYLPKMIQMAGGKYIFDAVGSEISGNSSTVSMQMEEFYAHAKDADYIIYNTTTVGEISSLDDLLKKNPLLGKFKAVENQKVFSTSNNLYQSSMELGTIIGDFQKMLQGEEDDFTYLYPLR